jgi:hypothetical protein
MRERGQQSARYVIGRGFDYLGCRFSPDELRMATQTVVSFVSRICQLDEQGADTLCMGQDVQRWTDCNSGLTAKSFFRS